MRLNRPILKGAMDLMFVDGAPSEEEDNVGVLFKRPPRGRGESHHGSIIEELMHHCVRLGKLNVGEDIIILSDQGESSVVYRAGEKVIKVFFQDEMLDKLSIAAQREGDGKGFDELVRTKSEGSESNNDKIINFIYKNELEMLVKMTAADGKPLSNNVMHCIDEKVYVTTNNLFYVFLPFYEGNHLLEYINKTMSKLPAPQREQECKSYLKGVLSGLAFMHGEGVYHRDIKPENIMISVPNNVPVIIDFGTCAIDRTSTKKMGSVGYWPNMAVERKLGVVSNEKIDIWGAGIVLYNMLFTSLPSFNDGTIIIQKGKYSPEILELLEIMTISDPDQRPNALKCLGHPCLEGIDLAVPSPMIAEPEPVEQGPIAASERYLQDRPPHISTSPRSPPRIRTRSPRSPSD